MTTDDKLQVVMMWTYMFTIVIEPGDKSYVVQCMQRVNSPIFSLAYKDEAEAVDDMYQRLYRNVHFMCNVIQAGRYDN